MCRQAGPALVEADLMWLNASFMDKGHFFV
jgi:hypothetical protein